MIPRKNSKGFGTGNIYTSISNVFPKYMVLRIKENQTSSQVQHLGLMTITTSVFFDSIYLESLQILITCFHKETFLRILAYLSRLCDALFGGGVMSWNHLFDLLIRSRRIDSCCFVKGAILMLGAMPALDSISFKSQQLKPRLSSCSTLCLLLAAFLSNPNS